MKSFTRLSVCKWIVCVSISIFIFSACQKETDRPEIPNEIATTANNGVHGHLKQTNTYDSKVVVAWIDLFNRILLRNVSPVLRLNYNQTRFAAYTGIALYESVVHGMPGYQSLYGQLNEMPQMPSYQPGVAYHWPTSANTVLAAMNRYFFPTVTVADKASIDSLETSFNNELKTETSPQEFQRSVAIAKNIAAAVYEWSKTDGSDHGFDPYSPPIGQGLWVSTPPNFPIASAPYWGNNRTIVPGSIDNTDPGAPIVYSEDPSSDFYKMAKDVYDNSLNQNADQKAIVLSWADRSGIAHAGHTLSILAQVLTNKNSTLDLAAIGYAKTGISICDAVISIWNTKYKYNIQRPITYIRNVLHHTTWNASYNTPAHPDYSSEHGIYAASAVALASIFGNSCQFTDHTYDVLGLMPRSFSSFEEAAEEAGLSKFYAGTNYLSSTQIGFNQGKKVGDNIESKLKFLKE